MRYSLTYLASPTRDSGLACGSWDVVIQDSLTYLASPTRDSSLACGSWDVVIWDTGPYNFSALTISAAVT